jgi:hypothetical protein
MHAGAPWSISPYYTKKLTRQTDALGNIISEPDAVAAAPGWTPDAQLRLAAAALAPELQRDAEELLDKARRGVLEQSRTVPAVFSCRRSPSSHCCFLLTLPASTLAAP